MSHNKPSPLIRTNIYCDPRLITIQAVTKSHYFTWPLIHIYIYIYRSTPSTKTYRFINKLKINDNIVGKMRDLVLYIYMT
jgi:hypothetical protein